MDTPTSSGAPAQHYSGKLGSIINHYNVYQLKTSPMDSVDFFDCEYSLFLFFSLLGILRLYPLLFLSLSLSCLGQVLVLLDGWAA